MGQKVNDRKKWMPAMYVAYFPILEKIANKHGYALCVHGSVIRDFDLIAVPFDEEVSSHEKVLSEIKEIVGKVIPELEGYKMSGIEPHNRMCYAIECGGGGYFDISFTPTTQQVIEQMKKNENRQTEIDKIMNQLRDKSSLP